ncbi:DUF485 domain-containing protein [Rhodobacteraceae bacterium DSL-40]|uniref:DUF485 domain-containing protein n=1 Tax=Amaricoccus sp. B4 TaxID=3368557 RepID=UPI000DACDFE1
MTAPVTDSAYEKISSNPKFQELIAQRAKLARILSILILGIYFGFILLVAYAPGFLGTPLGSGVTTIGVPVGVFVIVAAFVLTGVYVAKANTTFDQMNKEILEDAQR